MEETTETTEQTTEPEKTEETKEEERETSVKPEGTSSEEDLGAKAHPDRLYARMKKAEEEAKLAKEKARTLEEKLKSVGAKVPTDDVISLAKTVAALKDYSPEELERISVIAKGKGIPLTEAAQTEEAKLLIAAMREKVAKSKSVPNPSAPLGAGETTARSLREIKDDAEFEAKLKELDAQASQRKQGKGI